MSVCVAAIAEDSKKVILVADQMVTSIIPISYQFETTDVKKIYRLTDNAYAMATGNALFASEIVQNSAKKILDTNPNTFDEIAEIVRTEYQNYRRGMITKFVLEPRGLDLQTYYQNQLRFQNLVIQEIEHALVDYNIGVEMIVAGLNKLDRGEGHVYSITHPGILITHDPIGFVSVGIGAPIATYYLIGSGYTKSLSSDKVEQLVLEAKRRSEVAPGVGKGTTVIKLPEEKTPGKEQPTGKVSTPS